MFNATLPLLLLSLSTSIDERLSNILARIPDCWTNTLFKLLADNRAQWQCVNAMTLACRFSFGEIKANSPKHVPAPTDPRYLPLPRAICTLPIKSKNMPSVSCPRAIIFVPVEKSNNSMFCVIKSNSKDEMLFKSGCLMSASGPVSLASYPPWFTIKWSSTVSIVWSRLV